MRFLTFDGVPIWRDARVIRATAQIVSVVIVVIVVFFVASNVLDAADKRGFSLGFDFLGQEAGFPIAESVIEYDESNSFRYAFTVGVLNTLKVALIGIVAATVLGIIIGVARVSSNWLINRLANVYIETFRNIPLLVQLFFWYFSVFLVLPTVQDSIRWPGPIYLSNRGLVSVWASPTSSFTPWLLFLLGGVLLAVAVTMTLARYQSRTGRSTYPNIGALAAFVVLAVAGWFLVGESPLVKNVPELERFNYAGGLRFTPEFAALLLGLVIYTASFISEIVRAGIQSVPRGQVEAARALGLSELEAQWSVVFPQALRVIVPPLISQFLNLTKNSSLAIAIGYPDLFSIGRIMINQAGRAVPIFLLIMGAYLVMSLTYAVIGNLYNRHMRLAER
ncbi:MAG: ABC transporter permease subunit [Chloroflexi bacterium]|nr:ABC transporter permease subunit [Chloroflexota bacterium]MDA1270755.1 ABC transporter permease subunit [Chloroflexota bacterium]